MKRRVGWDADIFEQDGSRCCMLKCQAGFEAFTAIHCHLLPRVCQCLLDAPPRMVGLGNCHHIRALLANTSYSEEELLVAGEDIIVTCQRVGACTVRIQTYALSLGHSRMAVSLHRTRTAPHSPPY